MNKRNVLSSMVFLIAFLTLSSVKAETLVVKNELDHGPGSLRWALGNGAKLIRIPKKITSIKVTQPLEYNGDDALRIIGNGQVLMPRHYRIRPIYSQSPMELTWR